MSVSLFPRNISITSRLTSSIKIESNVNVTNKMNTILRTRRAFSLIQKRSISSDWQKLAYKLAGFNKYGLVRDDLLIWEDPIVQLALKRLPSEMVNMRNFRLMRATQLSCRKEILPKEQWTKFEDDVLYLTPVYEEVLKEVLEKEDWDKSH
ncbi:unnamed protein product [Ceutorhynchus assimilis]|uniref:Cytochrome b-c1 complex subunit 7 n=1 Tax=Ceutorhynchus assimilis TaxID=467358 RepID=A0A9P0GKM3_9CUCU|nr:unnamed protein product [Ceutorhynchus assimilis]